MFKVFEKYGDHRGVVFLGLGHQWNDTGWGDDACIFVVTENSNNSYTMRGGGNNDLYFGGQTGGKSKYIKCIKHPTAYIVEETENE